MHILFLVRLLPRSQLSDYDAFECKRGRMKLWEGGGVQVGWSRVERAGTEGVKKKSPLLAWSGPEWTRAIRDHPECQGSSLARGNQVPLECDRPRKTKQIFMPSSAPRLS